MSDPSPIRTIPNNYSRYTALSPDSKEISLLRILPAASPEAPLVVALIRAKLAASLPYEALSYCWRATLCINSVGLRWLLKLRQHTSTVFHKFISSIRINNSFNIIVRKEVLTCTSDEEFSIKKRWFGAINLKEEQMPVDWEAHYSLDGRGS